MAVAALRTLILVAALGSVALSGWGQSDGAGRTATVPIVTQAAGLDEGLEEKPLPDIPALMLAVEAHQKAAEAIEKDYLYHSIQTAQELDGRGRVKKTTTREYDVFWVEGVQVFRLTRKDGRDLGPEEQKKESARIDKQVARARKRREAAAEKGKDTDSRGNEVITVSRILELGSFTNPRRVKLDGRDTIVVDYTGDPKAKTRNRAESVVRDLAGTVWVDEQDRVLVKAEGRFLNTFKIGGGLVANIEKGTSFTMQMAKLNGEVWLPKMMTGHGAMRALVFFSFNGEGKIVNSDYRKFKASSTILPGMNVLTQQ